KRHSGLICLLISTFFISLLFVAIFVRFPGTEKLVVTAGDRVAVPVSAKWFREVDTGVNADLDTYLFSSMPAVSEIVYMQKNMAVNLEGGSFKAVRYDLYAGSQVAVRYRFDRANLAPNFLILRSEEAYRSFISGDHVSPSDRMHEANNLAGEYTFISRSRSEYYFIFYTTSRRIQASGNASFDVRSMTLNLVSPAPIAKCTADQTFPCAFDLTRLSGTNYVVFAAPVTGDSYTVFVRTRGRASAYFGVVTIAGGVFAVVIGTWVGCALTSCACQRLCCPTRRGYVPLGDERGVAEDEQETPRRQQPQYQPPPNPPPPTNPAVDPSAPPPPYVPYE
ncbi:hypothetical protein HK101_004890, partial [Irineochytrium annulatum]